MKVKPDHVDFLLPEVRSVLELDDEARIDFILQETWITYPTANDVFKKMERLLNHPKKSRMPGMLLVGATNNGKTSLIHRFLSKNTPKRSEDWKETTEIPIVAIQAPPSPNLSELYSNILEQFAVPFKNSDKTAKKEQQIKYYLGLCKLKMLVVDEIHNILSGPVSKQKVFMNALKNLSNDLQITIILVGIKEALRATNTDDQIANRFKPVFLPKWKLDRDYLSLLVSIEKTLPLQKASRIGEDKKLANKILDLSEGYIGEVIDLVTQAAVCAIENKTEHITLNELTSCGFTRPSHRKDFEDLISL
jgi:hypothetical protein